MYEVEVKARLRNREQVIKKLESLGCKFSEELHQIDRVFIPEGVPFPPPLGTAVLRVRKQNEKSFLTLKIPQSGPQDCIEKEMEISSGEEMVEIIKLLKYYEVPTVDKKRIKTNIGDIEVVLDEVKDLGGFIEAEKIVHSSEEADRKKTMEELFDFLSTLDIQKEDRVIDGKYDIMLFEKNKAK